MSAPPTISPDGAFWWDGQAWQPIPHEGPAAPPGVPVVEPAPPAWTPNQAVIAKTKPPGTSWLPDDMEEIPPIIPAQAPAAPKIYDTAPPSGTVPPPVWVPAKRNAAVRRVMNVTAIVVLVLAVLGMGGLFIRTYALPKLQAASSHSPQVATPAPVSPSPTVVGPLTANIASATCPVAHVGDPACLKMTFINTGPAIGNLAVIMISDPPYTNWFQHHFGADMAAKDNAAGCLVDSIHMQIVCGEVPAGATITIHLIGYAANVGTHTYGVRFADISSGHTSDVDVRPDGTPYTFSWSEAVT